MYSLMIVDDEEIILNGIRDAVTSSSLALKSVREASSGAEALKLLAKAPCDILLTDIRMPDMSGLEMAEQARRIWPETRVVFLTGYQDFEYARRALRLGSEDYLLKPIPDERLTEIIGGVIARLDSMWLERFELRYGQGDEAPAAAPVSGTNMYVLQITYQTNQMRMSAQELHNSLCSMLRRLLCHYCSAMEFDAGEGETAVLLGPSVGEPYWEEICWKTLEELQSFFLERLDVNMSIGLSGKTEREAVKAVREEMMVRCRRQEHYGRLFKYLREEKEDTESENYAVKAVQSYVCSYPERDLSLGALSERFRINPSYLSRVFHQETGIPISEFIVQVRLKLAKQLLADTDLKIYEIAQKAGFETPGYFTKVFNKSEHISPKNYRLHSSKDKAEK